MPSRCYAWKKKKTSHHRFFGRKIKSIRATGNYTWTPIGIVANVSSRYNVDSKILGEINTGRFNTATAKLLCLGVARYTQKDDDISRLVLLMALEVVLFWSNGGGGSGNDGKWQSLCFTYSVWPGRLRLRRDFLELFYWVNLNYM